MRKWSLLFGSLILFLLAACSDAAPPPPPDEILSEAVRVMTGMQGFHFSIDRSGAPAYIDAGEMISFRRAEGAYTAPDKARAAVRVIVPGLVGEVRMVAIADRYWETNFLTGEWVELPAGQAFNPAELFDAQTGLPPLLQSGISDLRFEGTVELDEMPGISLYLLSGTLDTIALYDLSFGLIGPEPAEVQMWVRPGTYETDRVVIIEPSSGPDREPTTWQVDFWDFGSVETITPPGEE